MKPYHPACFSKELQSAQAIFVRNFPINGFTGTSTAFLAPFIGLIIVLILKSSNDRSFVEFIPLLMLFFIPAFLRIYSYYKFEKPFK